METTIENRIAELQQMVAALSVKDPTQKELNKYSKAFTNARRALDQLDTMLKKNYDEYCLIYWDWAERHEQSLYADCVKRSKQLDLFSDYK